MATRLRLRSGFDPDEPRDDEGKWTSDGGDGDGDGSAAAAEEKPAEPDPEVISVGGDSWNRATAARLEKEYQAARPKVDKLAQEAPGRSSRVATPSEDEEEEPAYTPESWEELSGSAQEEAEQQYVSKNTDAYHDSEIENWYSSGGALDDAKVSIASDFSGDDEWAATAIADYRQERLDEGKTDIPFTDKELLAAISLDYEAGYEGQGDLAVDFDDAKLQDPAGYDPAQQTLPGVEPVKPEDHLTQEMRDGLTKAIEKAFDKEADDKSGSMEAPEYLAESAEEYAKESWDQMDDDDKFAWTKDNTNLVEDESTPGSQTEDTHTELVEELPTKFDPLNETTGSQYVRTQRLARYLSVARADQIIRERKLAEPSADSLARADKQLWAAWKGSSTSEDGKLLQLATADELGGRLNLQTHPKAGDINRDKLERYADREYRPIGGYAGVKAYVRAKWETTQYLLDKAGVKHLELYRGIKIDHDLYEKIYQLLKHWAAHQQVGKYTHMPTLHVARNGAASTTTDPSVANGWGQDQDRIVLRASVPRTAAISVPAYGQNIHSEHEVVVAGTAWKGWDAWAGKAPDFTEVPMKLAA